MINVCFYYGNTEAPKVHISYNTCFSDVDNINNEDNISGKISMTMKEFSGEIR